MNKNDPKTGEDWNFLDDESQAWYEALETVEDEEGNQIVKIEAYDEFENIHELVNFVAGTGSYSDTRQFTPTEEDKEMKKREMKNDNWKLPSKIEQINQYLEEGANRNEIDINPNAETGWNVTKTQANIDGYDTKYTAHFIAYNPDAEGENIDEEIYISTTWYDTPPQQINFEDLFNEEE